MHLSRPGFSGPRRVREAGVAYGCRVSVPTPSHGIPYSALRASDHDRQLVADVLTTAFAEGRITHEELEERLDTTWKAKTFADLAPVTRDLLGNGVPTQYATPAPVSKTPTGDEVSLGNGYGQGSYSAIMSTARLTRGGHLLAETRATCLMGDVKFDLRGATLASMTPEISVMVVMGDVKILVPAGVMVIDHTTKVMGDSSVKYLEPAAGGPVITVTGTIIMGDLQVRGPNHRGLGKWLGIQK